MNEYTAEALLKHIRVVANAIRLAPKSARSLYDFDRGMMAGQVSYLTFYGYGVPRYVRQGINNEHNFLLGSYCRRWSCP